MCNYKQILHSISGSLSCLYRELPTSKHKKSDSMHLMQLATTLVEPLSQLVKPLSWLGSLPVPPSKNFNGGPNIYPPMLGVKALETWDFCVYSMSAFSGNKWDIISPGWGQLFCSASRHIARIAQPDVVTLKIDTSDHTFFHVYNRLATVPVTVTE